MMVDCIYFDLNKINGVFFKREVDTMSKIRILCVIVHMKRAEIWLERRNYRVGNLN